MYYNKELGTCCISIMGFILSGCTSNRNSQPVQPKDTSLVNTSHLDYLYTPLSFSTGSRLPVYIFIQKHLTTVW